MKGVLKTKILKMIGLVFVSVFGFTGAVFGVMAAMGKFKTPVVYPTVLEFAIPEQVVVQGKAYDPELDWETQFADVENSPKIESFVLNGKNPGSKHEVNKTKCYLWFQNSSGSSLITLCDKDGHTLEEIGRYDIANGKYLVDCNEPIYYMVNKVDENEQTDGKVVLMARSENETLKQPDQPQIIWIDRRVESIFVDYDQSIINERDLIQEVQLGIDMALDFDYLVNTPLSLKPISKESAKKEIEIYYGYGTDYLRVTKEEVDKTSSPLHSILTYNNEGMFTFKTDSLNPKTHTFYIAVFPTYADRERYENHIKENSITNYDKLTKTSEDDEIYMTFTTLKITIEDIEISKAGLSGSNIVLDLYSTDNYIYLDKEGANNNLGLYMKKGGAQNQVDDYTRFDEVSIDGITAESWSNAEPQFSNMDLVWDANKTKTIVTTNLCIDENLKVIDYIYEHGAEAEGEEQIIPFYCNNGVAVLDTKGTDEKEDDEIKLLKTGSYLNFYIYNESTGAYVPATFDYEAEEIGTGREKKWNIISKTLQFLNAGESLRVGLLVVNNKGEFKFANYFDSIPVALNELSLSYTYKGVDNDNVKFNASSKTAEFSVTFDAGDENNINYPSLKVEDIFENVSGTYKNFVYVVEESETNMVDTLSNIKYVVGEQTYVLVGYLDDSTNKFVNEIRVNDHLSLENQSCKLYMLQIKHQYNQGYDEIFNADVLTDGKTFETSEIVDFGSDAITIKGKYTLNTSLLSYTYSSNEVYENTTGHVITVNSLNSVMLDAVCGFNDMKIEIGVTEQYSSRITIESVELDVGAEYGSIKIYFNAGEGLEKPNKLEIEIWMALGGVQFDLGKVVILNGSPESIVLRYDSSEITLHKSYEEALADQENYITAILDYQDDDGYGNGEFKYSFKVNEIDVAKEDLFNKSIFFGGKGFQDGATINQSQKFNVIYDVKDKNIFDASKITFEESGDLLLADGLILKSGVTVLQVTIDSTVGFIKIKTDTSKFVLASANGTQTDFTHETKPAYLKEFVSFTYEDSLVTPSVENMVAVTNLECIDYGDGELQKFYDETTNTWELKKNKEADAVLTIQDEGTGNGWVINKTIYYIGLKISFNVETVNNSLKIYVEFTSSVSISVSESWEQDRTLYSGTKISITGESNSLFNVERETGITIDVSFKIKEPETFLLSTFTITDDYIGEIAIVPIIGGTEIEEEFKFVVKPNVIATLKTTEIKTERLNENAYMLSDIYDLKSYNTTVVFGSGSVLYTSDYLLPLTDTTNIAFKTDAQSEPTLTGGQTLQVSAMKELGADVEKVREISLVYYGLEIRKDEFTITNTHEIDIVDTDNIDEEILTFKALKEYEIFASVADFELESISADNIDFDIDGNYFTINTIVNQKYENVELTLTFKKGEQELVAKYEVAILPYTPEIKAVKDNAYSGAYYDLLGGIYDVNSLVADNSIKKLYVTGLKYSGSIAAENDASSLIVDWVEGGSGYTAGVASPACVVEFKEMSGDNLQVYVEFSITYNDEDTYIYYVPLTISYRQTLTQQYPESDMQLTNGNFKFLEGCDADALKLSGLDSVSSDGIYTLTNLTYEAVLVYTNTSNFVTFDYDDNKKLSRVVASNVEGITTNNSKSTQLSIKLIAYQNNGGMADYANKIQAISHSSNTITLPLAQQGMFGTLIFKISTDSLNYVYYNIYVYCKNSNAVANVNTEHNLKVVVSDETHETLTTSIPHKIVADNTTYGELVAAIGGDALYYSTFKTDYNVNTTKIYLYDVEVTGGNFEGEAYLEVSNELIKLDSKFNTITLGLVIDDGVQEYCYGTITLYVQPENDIEPNGSEYELPNGYFTANVEASATQIDSPFGTSWSAEIISVDNETSAEAFANIAMKGADNSVVELRDRVAKDTSIIIKYTNNGTVVFVTYTYIATSIPTQTSAVITVGEFINEATGFNTSVDIKSTTNTQKGVSNKEYFFGTYDNEYTWAVIEGDTNNIELDKSNNIIRFTQTNEQQTFKVAITYTNFSSNDKTRTFTFKVLSGVHFVTVSSNDSGLTSTDRVNTTKKDVGVYSGVTGSSLTIEKDEISSSLYKYAVAGLTIYTNSSSKLILTFDKYNYVLHADEDGVLESDENIGISADDSKVNFVHSAQNQHATMTISVQTVDGKQFAQRNLYLNIVKTYTTLKSKYMVAGADHENVISGYLQTNIHSALLGNNNRVVLVDENGNEITTNVDLLEMGFSIDGNPNNISFTVSANASLKTNLTNSKLKDIQFNSVSVNTLCNVYLNNNAGIETNSVVYTYQIMAGDYVDGLDYSLTTGYDGTTESNPYISFLLEDTKSANKYSNKFVLGTMKDLRNKTVFLAEGFTESTIIEDGYYKDTRNASIGDYQNGIQYSIERYPYNLYLTLDTDSNQVELMAVRESGENTPTSNIVIDIRLGGVNGTGTITANLKVVLSNHDIVEKYNPDIDTSIYAGYRINLFEDTNADGKFDNGKFVENKGIDNDAETEGYQTALDYILAGANYKIAGQTYTIESEQTDNDLFVYDKNTKVIQTRGVASDVSDVTINFLVKDGDYVITTVTYKLNIYLNMKFVVNGDETSALETDFVLTNKTTIGAENGNKFPIEINFIDGSAIKEEDVKETTKTTYYKVLSYDLYRLKSQDNQLLMDKEGVDVTLNSNIPSDVLQVSDSGIVFYQDYSGEIELTLSIKTRNGVYSQNWTIYVTPILDIDLAKSESSILQTSASSAFNSGAQVELISDVNNRNDEGVGVVVNSDTNFFDYITYKYGALTGQDSVTVNYAYKIYEFNASSGISGLTSNQLFNLSLNEVLSEQYSKYFIADGTNSGTLSGHTFEIRLPNVPSTMDVQSYLVVYEVYAEYLDLTRADNNVEVFYVTYNVINKQKVNDYSYEVSANPQVWATSSNVDVTKGVLEEDGKYYLDLFYYQEELAHGGTTYVLKYSNNKIMLNTYDDATQIGDELFFNSGAFKYDIATRELSVQNAENTSEYELLGFMETTPNYKEITGTKSYYSVFESNFTNIVEYKNFIDLYLNKESVRIGDKPMFTLVEFAAGRYGIDLVENGNKLFNNELDAKLSLVVNDVETVGLEDFRLYVDNVSITAKTNDGKGYTIAEMGLGNYFTSKKDITINTPIIGVGTPSDNSWVHNAVAGTPTTDATIYGTISIPNGNANNIYNIYKVTYDGESAQASDLYTISQSYYYIKGETTLVVPSYTGVESYLYSVAYNPDESGNVSLNLANAVKVWTMDAGELVNSSSSVSYSEFNVISPTSGITDPTPNYANKTLTLSANVLTEYKASNSTAKSYPTITATIKVNGTTTLQLVIEYALPNA